MFYFFCSLPFFFLLLCLRRDRKESFEQSNSTPSRERRETNSSRANGAKKKKKKKKKDEDFRGRQKEEEEEEEEGEFEHALRSESPRSLSQLGGPEDRLRRLPFLAFAPPRFDLFFVPLLPSPPSRPPAATSDPPSMRWPSDRRARRQSPEYL